MDGRLNFLPFMNSQFLNSIHNRTIIIDISVESLYQSCGFCPQGDVSLKKHIAI